MDFEKYDTGIRNIVRRFAKNAEDIEDYMQLGRVVVWQLIEKDPDLPMPYLMKAVKNTLVSEVRLSKRRKIIPQYKKISLNERFKDSEDTLESVIGKNFDFSTTEELGLSLKEMINEKYGRFYITSIKDQHAQPGRVVKKIIRTFIEDVAGLSIDEVTTKVDYAFFRKYNLGRLLWVFYNNSPMRAVMDVYSGEFVPWDFRRLPNRYWVGKKGMQNAEDALIWFAEKNNIDSVEACRDIACSDFKKEGLGSMLDILFNGSPYLALKVIYPNLKPWKMKLTPRHFYNDPANVKLVLLDYLFSNNIGNLSNMTKTEIFDTDLKKVSTKKQLNKAGLRGLVARYDNSTYDLFNQNFPNKILPWFIQSKRPWKDNPHELAANAIKWLFEIYLSIPVSQIPKYATCKLFWNVGYSGILTNRTLGFSSSPYRAINNAYPGKFSKSDFNRRRKTISLDLNSQ